MWESGIIEVTVKGRKDRVKVSYEVKHFELGSQFGIEGGRISKLHMWIGNKEVVCYERGWDLRPDENDEAVMTAYHELLGKYN